MAPATTPCSEIGGGGGVLGVGDGGVLRGHTGGASGRDPLARSAELGREGFVLGGGPSM